MYTYFEIYYAANRCKCHTLVDSCAICPAAFITPISGEESILHIRKIKKDRLLSEVDEMARSLLLGGGLSLSTLPSWGHPGQYPGN